MEYKILLADDSPTIQKVVKITLANEPFAIEECSEASSIQSKLESFEPHVVLLDFNLSEDETGYQLAKKISDSHPDVKIMMLFGTFDTIDEDQLKASNVSAKIIKPFDGTKFITTCRSLIDDVGLEEEKQPFNIPEKIEDEQEIEDIDESGWEVNTPSVIEEEMVEEEEIFEEEAPLSSLEKEMQDWGMGIPGVIGSDQNDDLANLEIPDVISFSTPTTLEKEKSLLPDDDDLDYPNVIEISDKVESEIESWKAELNDLDEAIEESELTDTDPEDMTTSDEDVMRLQAEIADEVNDDLWSVDEEVIEIEEPEFISQIEEEVLQEEDYDLDKTLDEQLPVKEDTVDEYLQVVQDNIKKPEFEMPENLEERIFERIKPIIEEEIRKYCKEAVERIAWEVIPDLAENLVRKEIERISDDVLNSD